MSDDMKESLLCLAQTLLVVVTVVGLVTVFAFAAWESGYKHGWCQAKGGTYIADAKCDVNGLVVGVEREN